MVFGLSRGTLDVDREVDSVIRHRDAECILLMDCCSDMNGFLWIIMDLEIQSTAVLRLVEAVAPNGSCPWRPNKDGRGWSGVGSITRA